MKLFLINLILFNLMKLYKFQEETTTTPGVVLTTLADGQTGPPSNANAPPANANALPANASNDNTNATIKKPTLEIRPDIPKTGCEIFTPDPKVAPIYIQLLNNFESVVMPREDLVFMLRRKITIFAVCPSGFKDDPALKSVTLTCTNGKLIRNDTQDEFTIKFQCSTEDSSQLFIKKGDGSCPVALYAFGLNIAGQLITFAESCYDYIREDLYYVYYRALKPSQFISSYIPEIFLIDSAYDDVRKWDQVDDRYADNKKHKEQDINVRVRKHLNYTKQINKKRKRSIHSVTNQFIYKKIQDTILQAYTEAELPQLKNTPHNVVLDKINEYLADDTSFIDYDLIDLLPSDIYEPFIKNPLHNREFLQQTYAWDNLNHGNWKLFQKLLKLQTTYHETFEVYLGCAKIINAPNNRVSSGCIGPIDETQDFSSPINTKRLELLEEEEIYFYVGKYLWAYIKAKDPAKSFVAIGVNTPYYELYPDSALLCNDICDQISWLKKLVPFSKNSAFGIILCCPVDDVKDRLTGFPKYA